VVIITSDKEGGYTMLSVCLSVCLSVSRITQKREVDLDEILWTDMLPG